MTNFRKPDAVDRMREVILDADIDGDCWDEIGQPLDHGVKQIVAEYDVKLELRLDPSAEDKRLEVSEVRWGKLDREAKRLAGLGAALRDIAECIDDGTVKIRPHWQGAAADEFARTTKSVVATMRVASASLSNLGLAVSAGATAIRELYGAGEPGGYREVSETLLSFTGLVQPEDIYRMDGERIDEIPLCGLNCHDEESGTLGRTIVPGVDTNGRRAIARKYASNTALTRHWFRWYAFDYPQGTDHASDVQLAINESLKDYPPITQLITMWYGVTEGLKSSIAEVYASINDLLNSYTENKMFADLKRMLGV